MDSLILGYEKNYFHTNDLLKKIYYKLFLPGKIINKCTLYQLTKIIIRFLK